MILNFWSVALIILASHNLLLLVTLGVHKHENRNAGILLSFLLIVVFLVSISTVFTTTGLYHYNLSLAGFARGMVLLFGPLVYLYTLSILNPLFRLKPIQLLHLLPYFTALILMVNQQTSLGREQIIANIDNLMAGTVKMHILNTSWFIAYVIHLGAYLFMTRLEMKPSIKYGEDELLVPFQQRVEWLNRITAFLILNMVVFSGIVIYVLYTGVYSIKGNYLYIITLAAMVYFIVWQTLKKKYSYFSWF